jgi:membrane associated rhomboid family serine protease
MKLTRTGLTRAAARYVDGASKPQGGSLTDNPDDAWVEVRRFAAQADAEQHALVLAAVGIRCRLVARHSAIALSVALPDAARAREELASYARENLQSRSSPPLRALLEGLDGVLAYCAVLLFLHGASRRQAFSHDWWSAGAAQAGLIVDGEWWRNFTALGLHADLGHLASNLVFGSLLGLLLAQLLGAGLAWLAILLAGALGNALNALLHPAAHTAIGASTAVFAALGILAALTWSHRAPLWRYGLRRWLPLAAGVMLLAYLGVGGERTDIGGPPRRASPRAIRCWPRLCGAARAARDEGPDGLWGGRACAVHVGLASGSSGAGIAHRRGRLISVDTNFHGSTPHRPHPDEIPAPRRPEANHGAGGVAMPTPKPRPDETLIKALVRAHRWRRRIESSQAKSVTDLAEQEGVTVAYVCRSSR